MSSEATQEPLLAILDYGMGNLRSVEKAIEHVGGRVYVGADHERIRAADGLILPGVGAFPEAMLRIGERGLGELIAERLAAGTPLLGICLGMQLLFESSSENGGADGLGLLPGTVAPLPAGDLKVPNIGWCPVRIERESPIVAGIAEGEPFYFVHSLVPHAAEASDVVATAEHGERFAAIVARDRVFGAQFHPEKSSAAGLRMLRNFVSLAAPVGATA